MIVANRSNLIADTIANVHHCCGNRQYKKNVGKDRVMLVIHLNTQLIYLVRQV